MRNNTATTHIDTNTQAKVEALIPNVALVSSQDAQNDGIKPVSRYQQQGMVKQAFKAFVTNKANLPFHNEYGTKFPGRATLLHFMIYAAIRGKDPKICTHDTQSEKYQQAWHQLTQHQERLQTLLQDAFSGLVSLSELRSAVDKCK